MSEWQYVCEGCQTEIDEETGERYRVDKVRDELSSEGAAETLAQIHRLKTGHDPNVSRVE